MVSWWQFKAELSLPNTRFKKKLRSRGAYREKVKHLVITGERMTIPKDHGNGEEEEEEKSKTPRPSEIISWVEIFPYPMMTTTHHRLTPRHYGRSDLVTPLQDW